MKIFAARSCVISFAVLTKYLMSFYDMFGNREISLNFIRLLVHISRVDQRLLMCKHAQFRCHYGSRPGCHRVQGAMTQIYSQRMQDDFFPSGQRRFCIQFVQLILIWKTRFARLYRAFFFGRPLILWNSQLFVTNVPTEVGYTSVSISIPHTLCLLVFLWYQIRREYIFWLDDVSGQHSFIWYLTAIMCYLTLVQRRISLLSHSLRTMNDSGSLSHIYGLLVGL